MAQPAETDGLTGIRAYVSGNLNASNSSQALATKNAQKIAVDFAHYVFVTFVFLVANRYPTSITSNPKRELDFNT
jgi:hypothetical protein